MAISLVSLNRARMKSRDARRITDLRQITTALELYYDDNGQYPQPSRGWSTWSGHCPNYGDDDNYIVGLAPNYLPQLPRDPLYDTGSQCYLYNSDGDDYILITHYTMETVCDGTDSGTTRDPGDECNPPHIRQMDRVCCEQPTIAIYTAGARNW